MKILDRPVLLFDTMFEDGFVAEEHGWATGRLRLKAGESCKMGEIIREISHGSFDYTDVIPLFEYADGTLCVTFRSVTDSRGDIFEDGD